MAVVQRYNKRLLRSSNGVKKSVSPSSLLSENVLLQPVELRAKPPPSPLENCGYHQVQPMSQLHGIHATGLPNYVALDEPPQSHMFHVLWLVSPKKNCIVCTAMLRSCARHTAAGCTPFASATNIGQLKRFHIKEAKSITGQLL